MKIMVSLEGCDDTTYFDIEVDDNGLSLIKQLQEKSNEAASYSCEPVLRWEMA